MLALLAQLAARPGAVAENAERAAAAIRDHASADLAVFPELYLSGYSLRAARESALAQDAPALQVVAAAAAEAATAVVIGFPEARRGGVANAAACIDGTGQLAAVYRKTHLFGAEKEAFVPGEELVVAELAGRRAGILVCFDVEFPEPARALAQAGADLLVTLSANMDPWYPDHELATRARALDNRLPHVYVNLVGEAPSMRFVGGSRSIGPGGDVLAELPHAGEELLVAPISGVEPVDASVDYLGQLRQTLPVAVFSRRPAL